MSAEMKYNFQQKNIKMFERKRQLEIAWKQKANINKWTIEVRILKSKSIDRQQKKENRDKMKKNKEGK